MTAPLRAAILRQLRSVPEPCAIAMRRPMNIAQMGLIEDVRVEDGTVTVELCLTDPGCVHFNALRRYITDALLPLEGVAAVWVSQTTQVLWTPDRVEDS